MYFKSREEAGQKLAAELQRYKTQNIVVIALNEGSSVVAAQIAMELHCSLYMYIIKNVYLPGEPVAVAALSSTGIFNYSTVLSEGEVADIASEFQGVIAQERMTKNHELNVLMGKDGVIKKSYFRNHVVIAVADGLFSGFALDMVADYLKTIKIKKFIAVTPLATVEAIDRMHLIADDFHCLSRVDGMFDINHYYDNNQIPQLEGVVETMKNISLNWNRPGFRYGQPTGEEVPKMNFELDEEEDVVKEDMLQENVQDTTSKEVVIDLSDKHES